MRLREAVYSSVADAFILAKPDQSDRSAYMTWQNCVYQIRKMLECYPDFDPETNLMWQRLTWITEATWSQSEHRHIRSKA